MTLIVPMNWGTLPSLLALGLIESDDVEHAATLALVNGVENETLVRLAGGVPFFPDQVLVLKQALEERGIATPAEDSAAMFLARILATKIVNGFLAPVAGAAAITALARRVSGDFQGLDPFIYIDSEVDCRLEDLDFFNAAALEEARALLATT
jgi:hypothetical protein